MDETQLREIIRLILDAIEEATRPRRALVLFTGALLGFEESLAQVRQLRDTGLVMTGVTTTSAQHVLDMDKIAALGLGAPGPGLISGHDLLVIPTLTSNTAAKAARGIADTLGSNLVSEFLAHGKIVVAARTAADPDSPAKRALFPLMPPAQADLMRANLAQIATMGVRLCEVADLAACVRQAARLAPAPPGVPTTAVREAAPAATLPDRLVAAHHIQALPTGTRLTVPRDAIVTALATDLARARSIRIERV